MTDSDHRAGWPISMTSVAAVAPLACGANTAGHAWTNITLYSKRAVSSSTSEACCYSNRGCFWHPCPLQLRSSALEPSESVRPVRRPAPARDDDTARALALHHRPCHARQETPKRQRPNPARPQGTAAPPELPEQQTTAYYLCSIRRLLLPAEDQRTELR